MRRVLTVALLSCLYISLQAQDISFDALKDGVFDVAEIKKELILNGFTKVTDSSEPSGDTYAWGYDEDEETANIWVYIEAEVEIGSVGIYKILVITYGNYIHDELVEEITEKCTFKGIGETDELEYACGYSAFDINSEDGNNMILAYPNHDQISMDSPVMDKMKEAMMEEMTEEEWEEFMKEMEEIEEEK